MFTFAHGNETLGILTQN